MAVYVDPSLWKFGRMRMCHMWADSREELLAMVDQIGVNRKWIQEPPKASWLHFDIAMNKRARAVLVGAIEVDKYEALYQSAKRDGHEAMVATIEKLRARKAAS